MKYVLLPGMDGTGDMFAPLCKVLPGEHFVMTYPPDQPLGYAELAERVERALPNDEPFVIIAESFSGPIAVMVASRHPPGLKGVVLVATFLRNPLPISTLFPGVLGALPAVTPNILISLILFGGYGTDALRALLKEAMAKVTPEVWQARLKAAQSVDARLLAKNLDVPVLCLRAIHDHMVPRALTDEICDLVANAEFVDLVGPHALLQTKPKEAAELIIRFSSH